MPVVTMETLPAHVPASLVRPYPFYDGYFSDENPFATLIPSLHESGPDIFYTLDGYHHAEPMWVFRKYDDVALLYTDTEHFSAQNNSPFAEIIGESWHLVPAESDPPVHTSHRQMVNPLFTPKKMAAMEDHVRSVARAAVDKFRQRGEADLMAEMAFELPIVVFLQLMNMPLERTKQFLAWERNLTHPNSLEEIHTGTTQVVQYLREVITERRSNPGEDFVSYGVQTQMGDRPLTDDELVGFCFNLFIGGLDTVSTNMGWHIRHLAEHPEHQAELRAHPEKIPAAVEELMRAYSAVTTNRRCIKDITIRGVTIKAGDVVALATPLANRDPTAFDRPNEIILDRNPRHIGFATGIHRCVGAPLARREMIIGLEELLAGLPPFRIKPGAVITSCVSAIIQPLSLPLVWDV